METGRGNMIRSRLELINSAQHSRTYTPRLARVAFRHRGLFGARMPEGDLHPLIGLCRKNYSNAEGPNRRRRTDDRRLPLQMKRAMARFRSIGDRRLEIGSRSRTTAKRQWHRAPAEHPA
jgi:hypothetical protein